ncbi:MAG: ribonuclease III [Oscillospiraceae bacterium]|nr:ribonuclease III [Oscillospiraceae bacterium]MDD6085501.1 ribonuclease III [Oscillospiraceae bacterium]MDY3257675.1 ribonuclease III [Ruminococcus callidus]
MNLQNVDLKSFEKKIGYTYNNLSILVEALTHSSYANEVNASGKREKKLPYNERMEFLGDSILSLIVSDHLFRKYPDIPEGELTKVRAALVCEKALHTFAERISLGEYIFVGKGEEKAGGRTKSSILADAFEALIASIYLDGSLEKATEFVMKFIPDTFEKCKNISFHDYKTFLQEVMQKNPEEEIKYEVIEERGPAHNRDFVVEVSINTNVIGRGTAKTKKEAEQLAAREALKLMGYDA